MRFGVSYFGVRNPQHMERDLDDMVRLGFSYVVMTYSENDHRYYQESLARGVELAHTRGLDVWIAPWGVGGVFGGEAFSELGAWEVDAQQQRIDGRPLPLLCPTSEVLRDYLSQWVATVAQDLKADVIFWDEPHFYQPLGEAEKQGLWSCRCGRCQEAFAATYRHPMPDQETQEVYDWKQEAVATLVDQVTAMAAAQGLMNSVCILPDYERISELVSRLDRFAANPHLDLLSTDPYPLMHGKPVETTAWFCKVLLQAAQRHGKTAQMWLQGFQIKAGEETQVANELSIMVSHGIEDVAIWSYLATAYMSSHRCADPETLWRVFTQAMQRYPAV